MEEKKIYHGKTTIKITNDLKQAQEEMGKLEKNKEQYVMYRRNIKRFHGDKEYKDSFVFELINE